MAGPDFSEDDFFRAVATSGSRALLIGRRAIVAYGAPVLAADYDLWVHPDGVERLNVAVLSLGLSPTHTPDEARARGRYVLENGEHVDVYVADAMALANDKTLSFEDVWKDRSLLTYAAGGATIALPSVDDLFGSKDATVGSDEFASAVARAVAHTDAAAKGAAVIRWFRARYPTPRARFAYARRKYAEWTRPGTIRKP